MPTFRRRPIPVDDPDVEAIKFTGENIQELWDKFGLVGISAPTESDPDLIYLATKNGGVTTCRTGKWVVEDTRPNTYYSMEDAPFIAMYEAVSLEAEEDISVWRANYHNLYSVHEAVVRERDYLKQELANARMQLRYKPN